jgi:1-deoxy-D-xylulose-5-phosphate reductoisomerase
MAEYLPVKRLVVLGATGSIGRQTLDIVRGHPDRFEVLGLAGGRNLPLLRDQVREFRPALVSVDAGGGIDPDADHPHRMVSMETMAADPACDLVVVGTVGRAGLMATLAALRAGKPVALANKEVLVMAGAIVQATARRYGGTLVPVDSEHSAIWQCLVGEPGAPWPAIRRLILTASGGAFRDMDPNLFSGVTPEQALRHPTWRMGPKITVDSATLMNKGFEVLEANWLFGYSLDQIEVVQHRESIVHSMVEFPDGSIKAQLGVPDMRVPLQYALTYPERLPSPVPPTDFLKLGRLSFEEVDHQRFPCLPLALEAGRLGGTYPAVLSGADEVAVGRFLEGEIRFTDIHATVAEAVARHVPVNDPSLDDILEADAWARRFAHSWTALTLA